LSFKKTLIVELPFIFSSKNQLIKNIHTYLKRRIFSFSGFFYEKQKKLVETAGIEPAS